MRGRSQRFFEIARWHHLWSRAGVKDSDLFREGADTIPPECAKQAEVPLRHSPKRQPVFGYGNQLFNRGRCRLLFTGLLDDRLISNCPEQTFVNTVIDPRPNHAVDSHAVSCLCCASAEGIFALSVLSRSCFNTPTWDLGSARDFMVIVQAGAPVW
jgi:hypothetical protein